MTLVREVADEIRIAIFLFFKTKKINEFIVTNNKLANNFARLVTGAFELDVARRSQFDHAILCHIWTLEQQQKKVFESSSYLKE